MINAYPDSDVIQQRETDLWERVEQLQAQVDALQEQTAAKIKQLSPPTINLLRNAHLDITHRDYFPTSPNYAGDDTVAAHWYGRDWSDNSIWNQNTNTANSANALVTGSSGSTNWDKTAGIGQFGGNTTLATPLKKLYGTPNSSLFVRAIVRWVQPSGGIVPTDDLILVCELWETVAAAGGARSCGGTYIPVTAQYSGAAGGNTREYIVEAYAAYDRFTSDVSTFTAGQNLVANTRSIAASTSTDFVTLTWTPHVGVDYYNIYRRMRLDTDPPGTGTWQLIATVKSGASSFIDRNGTGTTTSAPSPWRPRVRANAFNFGKVIKANSDWLTVDFALYVPPTYTMPTGAADAQWIRIGAMKPDGSTPITMIDWRSIQIDRVSLSYNYGEWSPSAEDLTIIAKSAASAPPPTGGGNSGTGSGDPGPGGGQITCVVYEQSVNMADGSEKPARDVQIGDWVEVPVGGKIELSRVKNVTHGVTTRVYTIHTASGDTIRCSPSHPILTSFTDDKGTQAKCFMPGDWILVKLGIGIIALSTVLAVEYVDILTPVLIFEVEHPAHTFIAGNICCHNMKALEE
jgi:hypothetical protein